MFRKIGMLLIVLSLIILILYNFHNLVFKYKNNKEVENYIISTKEEIKNNEIDNSLNNEDKPKENKTSNKASSYVAILEIPNINLKSGIVKCTKNFNSIRYAISVDSSSEFPDKEGNFILYAHSGNSSIAFFKNLYKLSINDNIYVYFNGIKYHYIVFNKYDIEKTGKAKVIDSNKEKYITLITCNQQRKGYQMIIEGKLIDESNY